MATKAMEVHPPEEAARRLGGISVPTLVAILKAKGYAYTELKPGDRPWGRGRQSWGLTDDQIAAIVAGQQRRHPRPAEPEAPGVPERPRAGAEPAGKSRLRRGRARTDGR